MVLKESRDILSLFGTSPKEYGLTCDFSRECKESEIIGPNDWSDSQMKL